jgi:hypothetical protein
MSRRSGHRFADKDMRQCVIPGTFLRREDSVTSKLRNFVIFASTIVALAIAAQRPAAALAFDDISGKWCGSVSSYTFTPEKLIVILYSDKSRREYKVDDYEYADDVITVNWQRDGEKLFTKFSEFSGDDKLMVQLLNNAGPRREFRRCS